MYPAKGVQDLGQDSMCHALDGVADELGGGDDEGGPQQEHHRGLGVELEHPVVNLVLIEAHHGLERPQHRVDRHPDSCLFPTGH